ncbi:hypothetical protein MMC13_006339 [Lambiella insularis]|nr:hypothetical protein [Lambiella insularis]
MGKSADEFPVLGAIGLYAAETTGRGDCLFMALSDQLYGDESHHLEIRARVVQYMRDHAPAFKLFTAVNLGGGTRRNPRRKAATYSTAFDSRAPTNEEVDLQYRHNIEEMAKPGTYADHLEIQAFSAAYGIMVRIYQKDRVLEDVMPGALGTVNESGGYALARLAYHHYEHYSTVRVAEGPHVGVMNTINDNSDDYTSASDSQQSSNGGVRLYLSPPKPRKNRFLSVKLNERRKHNSSRERKLSRRARERAERLSSGFEALQV